MNNSCYTENEMSRIREWADELSSEICDRDGTVILGAEDITDSIVEALIKLAIHEDEEDEEVYFLVNAIRDRFYGLNQSGVSHEMMCAIKEDIGSDLKLVKENIETVASKFHDLPEEDRKISAVVAILATQKMELYRRGEVDTPDFGDCELVENAVEWLDRLFGGYKKVCSESSDVESEAEEKEFLGDDDLAVSSTWIYDSKKPGKWQEVKNPVCDFESFGGFLEGFGFSTEPAFEVGNESVFVRVYHSSDEATDCKLEPKSGKPKEMDASAMRYLAVFVTLENVEFVFMRRMPCLLKFMNDEVSFVTGLDLGSLSGEGVEC